MDNKTELLKFYTFEDENDKKVICIISNNCETEFFIAEKFGAIIIFKYN